jgi:hypothetical protein
MDDWLAFDLKDALLREMEVPAAKYWPGLCCLGKREVLVADFKLVCC